MVYHVGSLPYFYEAHPDAGTATGTAAWSPYSGPGLEPDGCGIVPVCDNDRPVHSADMSAYIGKRLRSAEDAYVLAHMKISRTRFIAWALHDMSKNLQGAPFPPELIAEVIKRAASDWDKEAEPLVRFWKTTLDYESTARAAMQEWHSAREYMFSPTGYPQRDAAAGSPMPGRPPSCPMEASLRASFLSSSGRVPQRVMTGAYASHMNMPTVEQSIQPVCEAADSKDVLHEASYIAVRYERTSADESPATTFGVQRFAESVEQAIARHLTCRRRLPKPDDASTGHVNAALGWAVEPFDAERVAAATAALSGQLTNLGEKGWVTPFNALAVAQAIVTASAQRPLQTKTGPTPIEKRENDNIKTILDRQRQIDSLTNNRNLNAFGSSQAAVSGSRGIPQSRARSVETLIEASQAKATKYGRSRHAERVLERFRKDLAELNRDPDKAEIDLETAVYRFLRRD